jgi:selenide,water dikinase
MEKAGSTEYRLTEYAHGAGCGCKIAPQVLQEILAGQIPQVTPEKLLVGHESSDDAAVYDLGNGQALISTTDFFMPIVDDAADFGRVAAANAISDVYAMGGKPILALAILGWPVNKLPAQLAREVINGARDICAQAGIPLAGGHSVDTTEPLFGLCVNGLVQVSQLKKNNGAQEGDHIFLTKPIGTGIMSTAGKKKLLAPEDKEILRDQLVTLNAVGEKISAIGGVSAVTDVTGFGLLGHLHEMAKGSGLTAAINYDRIPLMAGVKKYIAQSVMPDATFRNWNAYQPDLSLDKNVNAAEAFMVLADPQTNGGLLFTVNEGSLEEIKKVLQQNGLEKFSAPIGVMKKAGEKIIEVVGQ